MYQICKDINQCQTGGIVNIAKIYWTTSGPSGGFDLIWDATSNVIAFICEGTSWHIWLSTRTAGYCYA